MRAAVMASSSLARLMLSDTRGKQSNTRIIVRSNRWNYKRKSPLEVAAACPCSGGSDGTGCRPSRLFRKAAQRNSPTKHAACRILLSGTRLNMIMRTQADSSSADQAGRRASLLASHTRSQPSSQDPQDLQVAHSTPTLHQAAVESHKGLRLHLPLPCNPLCMATKQPSPAIAGVAPACRRP